MALLERLLQASSHPGDVVLDPFISLIKNRLQDTYGRRLKFVSGSARLGAGESGLPLPQGEGMRVRVKSHGESATVPPHPSPLPPGEGESSTAHSASHAGISLVRIIGEPTTPIEAATLAGEDKFQFQWWALGLVGARPVEQKKGADHGIDGKILFRDDPKAAKPEQIVIQVKGGKTGVKDVRDLRGVLDREKAAIGILISLQPPTGPMETEAASAGFYEHKTNQQKFPRLQLRTVKELMEGKGIERPTGAAAIEETFKKAPVAKAKGHEQHEMKL